jgi:putative restriction endonuclease
MQLVRIVAHHEDPRVAADLFASEGIAAIGWSSLGDLGSKTRKKIKALIQRQWKTSEQESARMTWELLTLRDTVKIGDTVFAYVRNNTVALVGEVVRGYKFSNSNKVGNKSGPVGYAHQIGVRWRDAPRNFSRFLLPKGLSDWVAGRGTIGIRNYDHDDLERTLNRISSGTQIADKKATEEKMVDPKIRGPPWTRDEDVLALALYKSTGSSHDDEDPEVAELSRLLKRTPAAVVFKLGNFKAVQTKGRAGLSHFAPMDLKVWREFDGHDSELYQEAEKIRNGIYARFKDREAGQIQDLARRLMKEGRLSTERLSQVLPRHKGAALRDAVLENYGGKCAFCDLDIREMLVAAHIHRWTDDSENRYNLSNTLCLCVLHHSAFDNGLLTVSDDGTIVVSQNLRKSNSRAVQSALLNLDNTKIRMPLSYPPGKQFLADHKRLFFNN